MNFDFFTTFFLNTIIVFLVTKLIFDWVDMYRKRKDEMYIDPDSVLFVTVESYEQAGQKYWLVYKLQDKEFLAQGKTEEEAIKNTISRWPEKEIYQVIEH